jgi:hypothetical protein
MRSVISNINNVFTLSRYAIKNVFFKNVQVPYTPMIVNHDVNATFHEDGKVQMFKFYTQRLRENMTVYISVSANNHVIIILIYLLNMIELELITLSVYDTQIQI